MKTVQDFFEDPWLKRSGNSRKLPKDVLFACTYGLDIQGVDTVEEAAFLRRTETRDELWIGLVPWKMRYNAAAHASPPHIERVSIGCAFAVPRKDDDLSACLNLLDRLFRARFGFYWPTGFVAAGIVSESAFNNLVGCIRRELEDNAEKARLNETEIVQVARELGLGPRPTGTDLDHWVARCPETNHVVYISAAKNSFGCGYCKRKGGPEELGAFVKERRERQASRSSERP